jgi:hypothetical protein
MVCYLDLDSWSRWFERLASLSSPSSFSFLPSSEKGGPSAFIDSISLLKPAPAETETEVSASLALESLRTMPLDLVDRRSGCLSSGVGSGVDVPSATRTVNSGIESSSNA